MVLVANEMLTSVATWDLLRTISLALMYGASHGDGTVVCRGHGVVTDATLNHNTNLL